MSWFQCLNVVCNSPGDFIGYYESMQHPIKDNFSSVVEIPVPGSKQSCIEFIKQWKPDFCKEILHNLKQFQQPWFLNLFDVFQKENVTTDLRVHSKSKKLAVHFY